MSGRQGQLDSAEHLEQQSDSDAAALTRTASAKGNEEERRQTFGLDKKRVFRELVVLPAVGGVAEQTAELRHSGHSGISEAGRLVYEAVHGGHPLPLYIGQHLFGGADLCGLFRVPLLLSQQEVHSYLQLLGT